MIFDGDNGVFLQFGKYTETDPMIDLALKYGLLPKDYKNQDDEEHTKLGITNTSKFIRYYWYDTDKVLFSKIYLPPYRTQVHQGRTLAPDYTLQFRYYLKSSYT